MKGLKKERSHSLKTILSVQSRNIPRPLKERTREMRKRALLLYSRRRLEFVPVQRERRVSSRGVPLEAEFVRRGDVERREEDAVARDGVPEEDFFCCEGVCEEVDCTHTM